MQTRTAPKRKLRPLRRTRAGIRGQSKTPRQLATPARQPFPLEKEEHFDHALGIDIEFKKVFDSSNQTDIAEYFDRFI